MLNPENSIFFCLFFEKHIFGRYSRFSKQSSMKLKNHLLTPKFLIIAFRRLLAK